MSGSQVIAAVLAATPAVNVDFQMGTVTQASPLLVQLDGSTAGIATRRLASYTPTLGHRVAVLIIQGSDRLCLGQSV